MLNLKKSKFYVIAIIAAVVVILAVIIVGLKKTPAADSAWLTENEIIDTFNAHDLALEKDSSKNSSNYTIGGIKPGIFELNESDSTFYVYIFDNMDERYDNFILWDFDNIDNIEFDGSVNAYHSKNASIVLEAPFGNGDTLDSNEISEFSKLANVISDTVFLYLNDGKTIVYHGESEHWRGTYTLKYYSNPIEDENGQRYLDTYRWETSQLAYRGDDLKNIGAISYKLKRGLSSGGEGTGLIMNDEGIVNLGGSGGNGGGTTLPQEIAITVIWNDQEESLILEP
ncbi:hypothetical protein [Acetobacterium sp.]|uniref:hypothetical protein n=1 Tax=Acetobacterium sp. TaxID=1872094 RepID=UPI000CAA35B4|nr:hypothetical protein [Acetobacterium sp.]MDO9493062.1 hypothetical protein [Acetobacterium sp.]PKM72706.1 MAG: hypothetical protein CVU92_07100 [Firmicutes bacterium HGW-Firmicutes-17]